MMSDWPRMFSMQIQDLKNIRGDINQEYLELFDAHEDFESTPTLNDNPYRLVPPNIDRLDNDVQKHEYRRAHEQIVRFDGVFSRLIATLDADLARQNSVINSEVQD